MSFAALGLAALTLAGCSQTVGQKQGLGTLLGAVAGGGAGAQVGKGRGKMVATGAGAALGALIGSEVGMSLDRADRLAMQRATQNTLETAPSGTTSTWRNPDSGNGGTVTPNQLYQRNDGAYCREFTQTLFVPAIAQAPHGVLAESPGTAVERLARHPFARRRTVEAIDRIGVDEVRCDRARRGSGNESYLDSIAVTVGAPTEEAYGTACRQADGSWQII